MPSAEARVPTDRASRYLAQLCRHLGEMGRMHGALLAHAGARMPEVRQVEWSDDAGVVLFARGTCTLHATPDALLLRLDADDEDALADLQRGFGNRLRTIGRRDGLRVEWRPVAAASSGPETAPTHAPAGAAGHRRRFLTTAAVAGVVMVVAAAHLAAGGALLVAPWAGGAALAAVLLGGVVVVAHLVLGGAAFTGARRLTHTGWRGPLGGGRGAGTRHR